VTFENFRGLWRDVYDGIEPGRDWSAACEECWNAIGDAGAELKNERRDPPWFHNLVVYALYPQHFNRDIPGITGRIGHLEKLGVNCLWLLPMLESPMRDEGFDISDYRKIRPGLFPAEMSESERKRAFDDLIASARERDISIIFDIALNHVSRDHEWFRSAAADPDSPYRDFFIWSDTPDGYPDARVIFKGLLDSNWTYEEAARRFYFHRFYPHQPDLNYRNPRVLAEIIGVLLFWIRRGIRGFRVDAAPYLWKEEGTSCENLPRTHGILKILRAAVEQLPADILLLAEACQPPRDVVDYFGDGDECQGAYHFPLMPQLFKAVLQRDPAAIAGVLEPTVTPAIPAGSQWFTFLRCHDELTLEMVSPGDREYLHGSLCRRPEWDFRNGEGVSARLSELFTDAGDAFFAHLLLLGLRGNPVIYYGDEFLAGNNEAYAAAQLKYTGYRDSRNLVRGPLDWEAVEANLEKGSGDTAWHLRGLSSAIRRRLEAGTFSHAESEELIVSEAEPLLQIRKFTHEGYGGSGSGRDGLMAGYLLLYNFSETRELSVSADLVDGYLTYLFWNGITGEDLFIPPDLDGSAGQVTVPPRGVLWLKRRS
jgi:maltose alpha-D-glucosyltransferase/alpha-amylase